MSRRYVLNRGFTLIEVLLTMSIFAILSGFVVMNLFRPQTQTAVVITAQTLVTELRQQQIKAMVGESEGSVTSQAFGVLIEPNGYTLFKGNSYNAADPNNFKVSLDSTINMSTTFSSSQIIFLKRSGEVQSFNPLQNTISVRNTASGERKNITINRYGVADVL